MLRIFSRLTSPQAKPLYVDDFLALVRQQFAAADAISPKPLQVTVSVPALRLASGLDVESEWLIARIEAIARRSGYTIAQVRPWYTLSGLQGVDPLLFALDDVPADSVIYDK